LGLGGIDIFNPADPFNRLMLKNITAKAIDGIRWINDNATG
jgi:hypothetical protein